jgi:HEAT repeat protein
MDMNRHWIVVFAILLTGARNDPARAQAALEPRSPEITKAVLALRTSIRERNLDATLRAVLDIRMNQGHEQAFQAVREVLRETADSQVHVLALLALAECDVAPSDQLPLFLDALKNRDGSVRSTACQILSRMQIPMEARPGQDAEADKVIDSLVLALADPAPKVRLAAIRSIGRQIHAAANWAAMRAIEMHVPLAYKSAVPNLLRGLTDADPRIREESISTLGYFGEVDRVVHALVQLLNEDRDPRARRICIRSIGMTRTRNPSATKALVTATTLDAGKETLLEALQAIGRIGAPAKEALPLVLKAIADLDSDVRRAAASALAHFGEAENVGNALGKALADDRVEVREAAFESLLRLRPKTRSAAVALLRFLRDRKDFSLSGARAPGFERFRAVEALKDCTPVEGVVTELTRVLKDRSEEPGTRFLAGELLRNSVPLSLPPAGWLTYASSYTRKVQPIQDSSLRPYPLPQLTKDIISALVERLEDRHENGSVRAMAADIIGRTVDARPATSARPNAPFVVEEPNPTGPLSTELKAAISTLVEMIGATQDEPEDVARVAVEILGAIGPEAGKAAPNLIKILQTGTAGLRFAAAFALGSLASGNAVIIALAKALGDESGYVSGQAASSLERVVEKLQESPSFPDQAESNEKTIRCLIAALKDDHLQVPSRRAAAIALWHYGTLAKAAVPDLIPHLIVLLKDKALSSVVRVSVVRALVRTDPGTLAMETFREGINDKDLDYRKYCISGLADIGPDARGAVASLVQALQNPAEDIRVRRFIVGALGPIRPEFDEAFPSLSRTLDDTDAQLRDLSASRLSLMAYDLKEKGDAPKVQKILKRLDERRAAEEKNGTSSREIEKHYQQVSKIYASMTVPSFWGAILTWAGDHLLLMLSAILGAVYFGAALLIFWLRPVWLVACDEALTEWKESAKRDKGLVRVGNLVGTLLGLCLFVIKILSRFPHALDGWVSSCVKTARVKFVQTNSTVAELRLESHVPLPVVLNGDSECSSAALDLAPKLRATFAENRGCVLIQGGGGTGKTSIACQLAQFAMEVDDPATGSRARGKRLRRVIQWLRNPGSSHRPRYFNRLMLPVFIADEPTFAAPTKDDAEGDVRKVLAFCQRNLMALIGTNRLSTGLVEQLVKQGRILVIVDRFSERTEDERTRIRRTLNTIPVPAVIVTSRRDQLLDGFHSTVLTPRLRTAAEITQFLENYFTKIDKRPFIKKDLPDACGVLINMVGEATVPVFLARTYADMMLAAKDPSPMEDLPRTIPGLMRRYLRLLNRGFPEFPDELLQNATMAIAHASLRCPARSVPKEEAILAIRARGISEAEAPRYFDHLITDLGVLRLTDGARVQFVLEPLGEYLAGLHAVATSASDEVWKKLLEDLPAPAGDPEASNDFVLALLNCCLAEGPETGVPPFVIPELVRRYVAGLNRAHTNGRLEDLTVLRVAQMIAWLCTKKNCRAERMSFRKAVEELQRLGEPDAKDRINYLEASVCLITSHGRSQETKTIGFALNTLAECLARFQQCPPIFMLHPAVFHGFLGVKGRS